MTTHVYAETLEVTVPPKGATVNHTFPSKTFQSLRNTTGVSVYTAISSWFVGYDHEPRAFRAAAVETNATFDPATGSVTPTLYATISDGNHDDGIELKARFIVIVEAPAGAEAVQ